MNAEASLATEILHLDESIARWSVGSVDSTAQHTRDVDVSLFHTSVGKREQVELLLTLATTNKEYPVA